MSNISCLKKLADNKDHYSKKLERAIQNLYNEAALARSICDDERAEDLDSEADAVFVAMLGIEELAELKKKGEL